MKFSYHPATVGRLVAHTRLSRAPTKNRFHCILFTSVVGLDSPHPSVGRCSIHSIFGPRTKAGFNLLCIANTPQEQTRIKQLNQTQLRQGGNEFRRMSRDWGPSAPLNDRRSGCGRIGISGNCKEIIMISIDKWVPCLLFFHSFSVFSA